MNATGTMALLSGLAAPAVEVVAGDQISFPLGPRVIFWLLCLLTLGGAIVTITRKNLIGAVMAMVATFFGIAGLYAMLFAHFLAAIQVLVYAGGIMVLFVFVIMVLNREESEPWVVRSPITRALGMGALVYLMVRLGQLLWAAGPKADGPAGYLTFKPEPPPADFGTIAGMGSLFFTDYLFPFEAISILLVIAVIGAVVLARSTVARATSIYDVPEGEIDQRQPQHVAQDQLEGISLHGDQVPAAAAAADDHGGAHGGGAHGGGH